MNTVIVVPVLVVNPSNHDDPLKFMVGFPLRPVLLIVGPPVAVPSLPSPDLSFHMEIVAPSATGTPVALGSAASSHRAQLGIESGLNALCKVRFAMEVVAAPAAAPIVIPLYILPPVAPVHVKIAPCAVGTESVFVESLVPE